MAQLSHKYGGTYTTLGAYLFKAPAPLDTRSVVETIGHLISKDVWKNSDYTAFNGLQVYVESTQELYILKDSEGLESDLQQESYFTGTTNKEGEVITPPATSYAIQTKVDLYWQKLASAADVSSLSGVFSFKGIAEAVSPDLSYIVTCQASEGDALAPIGTAVDLEGDVYYGWQIGSYQIWTDSLFLNSASTQYTREDDETTVRCVVYKGVYYFTTEQVDGDKTILEEVAGHQIKVYTTDLQREAPSYIDVYDGELTGEGYIMEYTAYRFTASPDIIVSVRHNHAIIYASDGTKVVDDVTIPDNSGHVYQIRENEYASNGQIWVKLGSPVEDWIIL